MNNRSKLLFSSFFFQTLLHLNSIVKNEGRLLTNNSEQKPFAKQGETPSTVMMSDKASSCQPNEKLLIILNKSSGLSLYSHEFCRSGIDSQVISGFISAMTSFMGFVMGKEQPSWKTVYGTDSVILVETGEWTFGVLAVSKETHDARSMLSRVTIEFEDCFEVFKNSDGFEGSAFREFDQFVRKIFAEARVTGRTIVLKRPEWRNLVSVFDLPSTAFIVSRILNSYEEPKSVQEIAELHSLQIDDVIRNISKAFWNNVVDLKFVPNDDDILILSEDASSTIFQKANTLQLAKETLKIIALFDGRKKLLHLMKGINQAETNRLREDLGGLINRGYIQRIPEECRRALLNECVLSALVSKGALMVGRRRMSTLYGRIIEESGNLHPWINRIMLTDKMQVHCIFDYSSNSDILNDIIDTLDYFIEEVRQLLSKIIGKQLVDKSLNSTRTECREKWSSRVRI
jgi:hypothetical protein